jgi:hypothetical protein
MVLIVTGTGSRVADSIDGGGAPVLHVTYTSTPQPGPPQVQITAPTTGSSHSTGASITFTGTASDVPDGDLSAALTWTSDKDGVIGTGATFSKVLSDGTHIVKASVTDTNGNPGSASITVTVGAAPQTISIAVAANPDDAEQTVSGGSMNLSSSDLEMGAAGSTAQQVGLRFLVPIPKGASITSASIQFRVDEVSTAAASLLIQGQAADNAAAFTTASNNISSRARTSASVAWTPPGWPTVNAAGPDQRTPNIAALLQEIVGRPGWSSGNAMVLIVTGTGSRVADSIDGGGAPVLNVTYTP